MYLSYLYLFIYFKPIFKNKHFIVLLVVIIASQCPLTNKKNRWISEDDEVWVKRNSNRLNKLKEVDLLLDKILLHGSIMLSSKILNQNSNWYPFKVSVEPEKQLKIR